MLRIVQKTIPLPAGAVGLALEADAIRVIGANQAAASAYLSRVRDAWSDIVREAAKHEIYQRATAAFKTINEELAEAKEAEALGVPPPAGRSSEELQERLDAGRAAFKEIYGAVSAAATVADINAALEAARERGLTWLVPEHWEPYVEACPWTLAS